MKLRDKFGYILLASVLLLTLSACEKFDFGKKKVVAPQDPLWSEYISAHTKGLISRNSSVRIKFVNDVISKEEVGKSAKGLVEFEPSIDGKITFSSRKEIVLVPENGLSQGQSYQATVDVRKLMPLPEKLDKYKFPFRVIKQDFEVKVLGLQASSKSDKEMELSGKVTTADVEESEKIEQLVTATVNGESLKVSWQHEADAKHHSFKVSGVKRGDEANKLILTKNGDIIGVKSGGTIEIEIPAVNVFKITDVKSIQGDEQYIVAYFSDNVNSRQNLKGLIDTGKRRHTTRVEGNTIKIYPAQKFVGKVTVTLRPGIRNRRGERLKTRFEKTLAFASQNPQVKFVGKGVILPENDVLSVPIEAINVDSVQVTAFRIYDDNVGQFLQSNTLKGTHDLGRVGRYLWRKTISLSTAVPDKWNRYSLDATQLLKDHPGGMFRLTVSINRSNSIYSCSEEDNRIPVKKEKPLANHEDLNRKETSGWDFAQNYYGADNNSSEWRDRRNPCKDSYYRYSSGVSAARNLLASNVGLVAKRDQTGQIHVVATNLRNAEPSKGVDIQFLNFQNQVMQTVKTDGDGFAKAKLDGTPFYIIAEKDGQKGYLKLSKGAALPVAHFDVGGQKVVSGVKGHIYGERGVWRPGDDIYLTFVLEDKANIIPENHPVSMRLYNPKGQLIQSVTNSSPVGDFYSFKLKTDENAPTGNWTAKAQLGGSLYSKILKIETVVPNRLKVELDLGTDVLYQAEMPINGKIFGQWLHGATASGLRTDIEVRMTSAPTRFNQFSDYIYDDPARIFRGQSHTLFEGQLDASGNASFKRAFVPKSDAPGKLLVHFTTRVFEQGGAFSSSRKTVPYFRYKNFVGIKLPKGDPARGMLLTDKKHTVSIASLSAQGKPVSLNRVQVTLYKIGWKWWWDKSGESLAQYTSASHSSMISQGIVSTKSGRGSWEFEVKYPQWGRYLVRACDLAGQHCTGKIIFIDWPGWAGRAQEQSGPGASVLNFFSDKQDYTVGETAIVQLPKATQGRALLSLENGSRLIDQKWVELSKDKTKIEIPITAKMSPNIYVSITLIQPHEGRNNDRPIRLYGVIPIRVTDPDTKLNPIVVVPEEWAPESSVTVDVSEKSGSDMTYTLAVVDEGLLGLTGFKTPNLYSHFYKKEALGVTTWDLFDLVAGSYSGDLERLLALGGGDDLEKGQGRQEEKRRFPPVVKFLGPFELESGETNHHEFNLPQYVGAVRVMVVAGNNGAYGSSGKSVFVRESLTLLPTLPRVVGPEEELTIPVSIFVMDESIKNVTLNVEPDANFELVGTGIQKVTFTKPGDKLGFVRLRVKGSVGKGKIRFSATSGSHTARSDVYIDIRSPNPKSVTQQTRAIRPGEEWQTKIMPHGLVGTNEVVMEISSVPPFNLESRLQFLIRYPHGCLEQTTSSVFPQLYLSGLMPLGDAEKDRVEKNVKAGIDRLKQFQVDNGGFVYWPGGYVSSHGGGINQWANNYAGHFLIEAQKLGHFIPPEMMANWINYQKSQAGAWQNNGSNAIDIQAYRLYTLALAGEPEIGSMNRMKESTSLSGISRWQLAAAYKLAGQEEVASEMVQDQGFTFGNYSYSGLTFRSNLRDQAIALHSLVTIGDLDRTKELSDDISKALSSNKWHNTHAVSYALLAMSRFVGASGESQSMTFETKIGSEDLVEKEETKPVYSKILKDFPDSGETATIRNTGDRLLYASFVTRGTPRAGEEKAVSSGLQLQVNYSNSSGNYVDVSNLSQGTDFVANVTVKNTSGRKLENLALTHIVASGWEIRNERLNQGVTEEDSGIDYRDTRDDRVFSYFGLKPNETKKFNIRLNAAYLGNFYLPGISIEAMYDVSKNARIRGQQVTVKRK